MASNDLYERVSNQVPDGTWLDLEQILFMIGSSSKSYVKMSLFAMPNIQARRVMTSSESEQSKYLPQEKKWKWQFRKVSDETS